MFLFSYGKKKANHRKSTSNYINHKSKKKDQKRQQLTHIDYLQEYNKHTLITNKYIVYNGVPKIMQPYQNIISHTWKV